MKTGFPHPDFISKSCRTATFLTATFLVRCAPRTLDGSHNSTAWRPQPTLPPNFGQTHDNAVAAVISLALGFQHTPVPSHHSSLLLRVPNPGLPLILSPPLVTEGNLVTLRCWVPEYSNPGGALSILLLPKSRLEGFPLHLRSQPSPPSTSRQPPPFGKISPVTALPLCLSSAIRTTLARIPDNPQMRQQLYRRGHSH